MRKLYIIDTSAAKFFYLPASGNTDTNLAFLAARRSVDECRLFIPSFCIAELFNVLACYYYRDKTLSKKEFEEHMQRAKDHVRHPKRFLYPLELTRYHNYRLDSIFPVEHGTETEYDMAGLKAPASKGTVTASLKLKNPDDYIGKYHLSAADLLIIGMGMELAELHGQDNVAIITSDRRLAKIGTACNPMGAPPTFYAPGLPTPTLQKFHEA